MIHIHRFMDSVSCGLKSRTIIWPDLTIQSKYCRVQAFGIVPSGDAVCQTGNGITGWTGGTGQYNLFGQLFHYLFDILHPHPVQGLIVSIIFIILKSVILCNNNSNNLFLAAFGWEAISQVVGNLSTQFFTQLWFLDNDNSSINLLFYVEPLSIAL